MGPTAERNGSTAALGGVMWALMVAGTMVIILTIAAQPAWSADTQQEEPPEFDDGLTAEQRARLDELSRK